MQNVGPMSEIATQLCTLPQIVGQFVAALNFLIEFAVEAIDFKPFKND